MSLGPQILLHKHLTLLNTSLSENLLWIQTWKCSKMFSGRDSVELGEKIWDTILIAFLLSTRFFSQMASVLWMLELASITDSGITGPWRSSSNEDTVTVLIDKLCCWTMPCWSESGTIGSSAATAAFSFFCWGLLLFDVTTVPFVAARVLFKLAVTNLDDI